MSEVYDRSSMPHVISSLFLWMRGFQSRAISLLGWEKHARSGHAASGIRCSGLSDQSDMRALI